MHKVSDEILACARTLVAFYAQNPKLSDKVAQSQRSPFGHTKPRLQDAIAMAQSKLECERQRVVSKQKASPGIETLLRAGQRDLDRLALHGASEGMEAMDDASK